MSTRATYCFEKRHDGMRHPRVTFYIHHDGYPSGAAYYLWNAHHCENQKGGFALAFARANDNAELTAEHSQHGDTQFRYTCVDGDVTAEKCYYDSADTKRWGVIFEGPYWKFINANPENIENFSPIREIKVGKYYPRAHLFSRQQIEAQAKAKREYATQYRAANPECVGNCNSIDSDAEALETALAEYNAMSEFEGAANE